MKPTVPPSAAAPTRPIRRTTLNAAVASAARTPTRPSVAPPPPRTTTRPSVAPPRTTTKPSVAPVAPPPEPPPPPVPPPPLTAHEVFSRLIALTPEPDPDLEIDQLLDAFNAMLARRADVLADIVPPLKLDGAASILLTELERRDSTWQDLLASALRLVGDQRRSLHKLRAYGGR